VRWACDLDSWPPAASDRRAVETARTFSVKEYTVGARGVAVVEIADRLGHAQNAERQE